MHMVGVPAESVMPAAETAAAGLPSNVRRFGANSWDLVAIADWLRGCRVATVAMESTGTVTLPSHHPCFLCPLK